MEHKEDQDQRRRALGSWRPFGRLFRQTRRASEPPPAPPDRLRDELRYESLPLPTEGAEGDALLEEILYARRPPLHERTDPCYGSLVFARRVEDWLGSQDPDLVSEISDVNPEFVRRFADGRSAFLIREGSRLVGLACFDRNMEYEASLVELQRSSGAYVVQRNKDGLVRIYTPETVLTWDTIRWTVKPRAGRFGPPIVRLVPQATPDVLDGLLELCVYWLSPAETGATIVWYVHDVDPHELPHVDLRGAQRAPSLSAAQSRNFGALLSALGQIDGAAIVLSNGQVTHLGGLLQASDQADELIPAAGGARHTSARRFSYDEPRAVVFVVSQDGPVSVFSDGARTALIVTGGAADNSQHRIESCSRCGKALLIEELLLPPSELDPTEPACPVCAAPVAIQPGREAVRGVRKVFGEPIGATDPNGVSQ